MNDFTPIMILNILDHDSGYAIVITKMHMNVIN